MRFLALPVFLAVAASTQAAWFTNSFAADAFVRASAPGLNYGGAGALSVSGSNAVNGLGATNGAFDSFIRINSTALVSNFDSTFGTNNWVLNGARLTLTELGAPANTLFNRGIGSFEIRWIANDTWVEGTGTPNAPTMDGIDYNTELTLLNSSTDLNLGMFTNSGVDGVLSFWLALPSPFDNDLSAGGEVGLYLKAIDPGIGFTFDSRSFQVASGRPALEISAIPRPGIASLSLAGADVVLACTNGVAGGIYVVLWTTNLASQATQWFPIATNSLPVSGNFSIILTNAANRGTQGGQYFMLRTQ
jgi:hypothetical protein